MRSTPGLNTILDTDSYKASHYLQYPPGTTWMQSHFVARSGADSHVVNFGLQAILHGLECPDREEVKAAGDIFTRHGLPFNYEGWNRIADLGYLPIKVKALPEGTRVPLGCPLFTVESTDSETFWIVGWLETRLVRLWHPINVATLSDRCRTLIMSHLERTADNPELEIDFKLHDFGSRGVSSCESAAIGGMGHLLSFKGSDTVVAIEAAARYYNCAMAGFSIPASEHSTITSWGEAKEYEAFANLLEPYYNTAATVACVSDSYDIDKAVAWWAGNADLIEANAITVVIRPDSGDPATVALETIRHLYEDGNADNKRIVNKKGFMVLQPFFRVIYGDGINYDSIDEILNLLGDNGFSASNIAFGMGGALLQHHNRDTHGCAYKCNAIQVDGKIRPVFKRAPGKVSIGGVLDVVRRDTGQLVAVAGSHHWDSALRTVYDGDKFVKYQGFDEIREVLRASR
jgi:nicotinamide phosphoribosyltransferase